jgi:hypothetical protein
MLSMAMDDEVDAYLGRGRYERSGEFRGYRNGSTPRRLTLGSGTVAVAQPRVRRRPGPPRRRAVPAAGSRRRSLFWGRDSPGPSPRVDPHEMEHST